MPKGDRTHQSHDELRAALGEEGGQYSIRRAQAGFDARESCGLFIRPASADAVVMSTSSAKMKACTKRTPERGISGSSKEYEVCKRTPRDRGRWCQPSRTSSEDLVSS